jgi:alpha-glucosidase
MVNYYERVAREAAKRRLLVDFHGAYNPTGLYRTYPNVITSEGVLGLEQSKWGDLASPDNAVTFPFLRMMAGPVDYTPGAMMNATKADFKPVFNRPMSQGTRCQQLAMYVVYESPLQMLADRRQLPASPRAWRSWQACPRVDDPGAVGHDYEHILVARRNGTAWYVAAMTNWSARDVEVPLSFLGPGPSTALGPGPSTPLGAGVWEADIFRDGPNADRAAVDYAREKREVGPADRPSIHLAPGGGWVAKITRR